MTHYLCIWDKVALDFGCQLALTASSMSQFMELGITQRPNVRKLTLVDCTDPIPSNYYININIDACLPPSRRKVWREAVTKESQTTHGQV